MRDIAEIYIYVGSVVFEYDRPRLDRLEKDRLLTKFRLKSTQVKNIQRYHVISHPYNHHGDVHTWVVSRLVESVLFQRNDQPLVGQFLVEKTTQPQCHNVDVRQRQVEFQHWTDDSFLQEFLCGVRDISYTPSTLLAQWQCALCFKDQLLLCILTLSLEAPRTLTLYITCFARALGSMPSKVLCTLTPSRSLLSDETFPCLSCHEKKKTRVLVLGTEPRKPYLQSLL